jgi:hypothetical protein
MWGESLSSPFPDEAINVESLATTYSQLDAAQGSKGK